MKKVLIFLLMSGLVTSTLAMDVSPTAARPSTPEKPDMPEDLTKLNYFDVLRVPYNAGTDQIKKAYRTLSVSVHPDKWRTSKEAEELASKNFTYLKEAYESLMKNVNPISRVEPLIKSSLDVSSAITALQKLREAYNGSPELNLEILGTVSGKALKEKFKSAAASFINDTRDASGKNLLHQAIANSQPYRTVLFLNAGADPNSQVVGTGSTPLIMLASRGDAATLDFLLSGQYLLSGEIAAKVDINKVNNNGATALFIASQAGHKDIVNKLIAAGADINKSRNDGATPQVMAISQGHPEVAKILIQAGADVNRSFQGQSLLQLAQGKGMNEVVKLIQSKLPATSPASGPSVSAAGAAAMSPTINARTTYDSDVGWNVTQLDSAIKEGDVEKVRSLLAQGANPNLEGYLDNYPASLPIGRAINLSNKEPEKAEKIVDLLIAAGADLKPFANYPIKFPRMEKSNTMPSALKKFWTVGSQPSTASTINARTIYDSDARANVTELDWAIKKGDVEKVQSLLTRGANPNLEGYLGTYPYTLPIHRALTLSMSEPEKAEKIVDLLIAAGADLKPFADYPIKMPMMAKSNTMPSALKKLWSAGSQQSAASTINDRTIYDPDRMMNVTPLDYAIEKGDVEKVRSLLAQGANPNLEGYKLLLAYPHNLPIFRALYLSHREPEKAEKIVDLLIAAGADLKLLVGYSGSVRSDYLRDPKTPSALKKFWSELR